jgi:hypothetical protein
VATPISAIRAGVVVPRNVRYDFSVLALRSVARTRTRTRRGVKQSSGASNAPTVLGVRPFAESGDSAEEAWQRPRFTATVPQVLNGKA